MFEPITGTIGLITALIAFIKIAGSLAIIGVGWFIVKDIINTVSLWLSKIASIAFKAISFTFSFFRSMVKDASKNATPEKKVEYANIQHLLESNNVDSLVLAQNTNGNIVEVAGINANNHTSSVNADENPENYILTVTTSGEKKKIKING